MIPPVEDLDRALIPLPRGRTSLQIEEDAHSLSETSSHPGDATDLVARFTSAAPGQSSTAIERTGTVPGSAERGLSGPSSPADLKLDLSTTETGSPIVRGTHRASRRLHLGLTDQESDNQTSARPRVPRPDSPYNPAYKVKPQDTLRSIARGTLGDSRRANESVDLNPLLGDDPSHLIVGQILRLPEDTRTIFRGPSRQRSNARVGD
jgi:hypothetical protein